MNPVLELCNQIHHRLVSRAFIEASLQEHSPDQLPKHSRRNFLDSGHGGQINPAAKYVLHPRSRGHVDPAADSYPALPGITAFNYEFSSHIVVTTQDPETAQSRRDDLEGFKDLDSDSDPRIYVFSCNFEDCAGNAVVRHFNTVVGDALRSGTAKDLEVEIYGGSQSTVSVGIPDGSVEETASEILGILDAPSSSIT